LTSEERKAGMKEEETNGGREEWSGHGGEEKVSGSEHEDNHRIWGGVRVGGSSQADIQQKNDATVIVRQV
jgi:hypothetical protein